MEGRRGGEEGGREKRGEDNFSTPRSLLLNSKERREKGREGDERGREEMGERKEGQKKGERVEGKE